MKEPPEARASESGTGSALGKRLHRALHLGAHRARPRTDEHRIGVSGQPVAEPTFDTGLRRDERLRTDLALIFFARTALNSAHRIIYPFLPALARGLGISVAAATGLVAVRTLAGLTAPLFGPLGDRFGRRRLMEWGLLAFLVAGVVLVSTGTYGTALVAFALFGLSKVLYDPAVHAYVGDEVPYRQRGRAIGIVEMSWAGAWLLGVPASGFLIERLGWRAPWLALVVLGLLGLWLTHTRLPAAHLSAGPHLPPGAHLSPRPEHPLRRLVAPFMGWRQLLRRRNVLPLLLASVLLTLSNEIPFIVYGAWLEDAFGLALSAVGLVSIVIGVSEATAELGTTLLTDRLGKRRSVVLGLCILAATLVGLPFLSRLGITAALAGVALMMLSFEFAIVSLLPLATEIAPEARGLLLSFNVAAMSLGRLVGSLVGGRLWETSRAGILPPAIAGAACALLAALLLGRGVKGIVGHGDAGP